MTKLLLAVCGVALVVVGVGLAYPDLFGLGEPKPLPPIASAALAEAQAQPKKAEADKGCCGEGGCACAAKEKAKPSSGCGCCGGPPRLAHVSISVNVVTLMSSPQGQGALLAPSVWMALRRVDVTPN